VRLFCIAVSVYSGSAAGDVRAAAAATRLLRRLVVLWGLVGTGNCTLGMRKSARKLDVLDKNLRQRRSLVGAWQQTVG
jgi:hypothetical protein